MTVDGVTVAVVGAGYSGKRGIYQRIAEFGARIVIVDEPGHWSDSSLRGWPRTGSPRRSRATPTSMLRRCSTRLSANGIRPDAVLTFWETCVPVAARAAAALGLQGNRVDAIDTARSKLRTREASERAGLPTPRSRRVRSLDELYAAAAEIGFPAVVKPEFGAAAVGCVRVDSFESLPEIYWIVRKELETTDVVDLRAGNDLVLEEYLDGVEFDVDLVLEDGECVFSSVSQNWPTAEPSFQETGLHCPPDYGSRPVGQLVELAVKTVQAFGFSQGVLHVEGKCTAKGPRIVEVNVRMGGGRIHQIVEAVWEVDLIQAHVRSAIGLPQQLMPSRKPRYAVVNSLVYAPATGRLEALPFMDVRGEAELGPIIDISADVGQEVNGPDQLFPTMLADVYVGAKKLRRARSLAAEVLRDPPVVVPLTTA